MTHFRSDLLRVYQERGFIHQITDPEGLDARAASERIVCYVGYDCTADSLHIGHLVSIMMLRWLQKTGHRPVALMGGGTTKVGDPSGKDDARKLLTEEIIATNLLAIRKTFASFLHFGDGPADAVMANNAEWLDELRYIPFLRDIGRHFSVNRMLTMDSVKLRLERDQPLSFLEFNYMLLQSYDFVELAKRYGCNLQMGGSDQWGNIVMGVELGRRIAELPLFGLTTPLITTASGQKMGKTASGAIWLGAHRLAPYDYYQFWRNTEDADVGRFAKLFTELPLTEIARLEALAGAEINEAKKIVALEATKLLHGEAAAQSAAQTARQVFEQGTIGADVPSFAILTDTPVPLRQLLVEVGVSSSASEGRRLIEQGAIRIDGNLVSDWRVSLSAVDIKEAGSNMKISAGKKKIVSVRAKT